MLVRSARLIALLTTLLAIGGARSRGEEPPAMPKGYVAYRAAMPIGIDGRIDEPAWDAAAWSDDFVDIEGDRRPRPRLRTRVRMLWDDQNFYIAAELAEPHVQATFTKHDSYIFHEDNDFEVFIDPDGDNHQYAELEMNAFNTTWDLRLTKPYRDGGKAEDAWEFPNLRTAVHVFGTVNNPRDVDRGWSIEISVPWSVAHALHGAAPQPPRDGDRWRVNFSRVQWQFDVRDDKYVRRADRREDNWVWSPQGTINMHKPERWGYVQFSSAAPGTAKFHADPAAPARNVLQQIYEAQAAFRKQHQRFAASLDELQLGQWTLPDGVAEPRIQADADRFDASVDLKLPGNTVQRWTIRHDSRTWSDPPRLVEPQCSAP